MRGVRILVTIFILISNTLSEDNMKRYASEMAMGDPADQMGSNPHSSQPKYYDDFGRRFVPQYPYVEIPDTKIVENEEIIPQRASPELVLNIARQSASLAQSEPKNPANEFMQKQILRTGEYWNGVWKQDGNPKRGLRNSNIGKGLKTIKVKILPGSKHYDLISQLQKISPRLLYIINKKNYD